MKKITNIEITKREVLFSVCIIAVLLIIGFSISSAISSRIADSNEQYYKAVKITDTDLFQYGMDTNVGNAFVYGELKAVDPVTYDEIGGKYMYVKKVKERYTMHTRTVTYKVGNHTQTRTEHYWTWDCIGVDDKKCKNIKFVDIQFPVGKIEISSSDYITTIKESSHIRHKYYGTPEVLEGTIFTSLKDGTITDNSQFSTNKKIQETMESYVQTNHIFLYLFWLVWIGLIVFVVYLFYALENKWLE
jgi:hypothetical protein